MKKKNIFQKWKIYILKIKYNSLSLKIGTGNYNFKKLFEFLKKNVTRKLHFQTARNKDNIKMMKYNINFLKNLLTKSLTNL